MRIDRLLFVILITMMVSCVKDKVPSCDINTCENFPEMGIITFIDTRYQYQLPSLNPSNNDEIIFLYKDKELSESKLYKYNLVTQQKIELISNISFITRPKWSTNGFIAFDKSNYQISIMQDDGSDLNEVTNSIHNIFPVWNYDGSELFYQHSPVLGIPYFFLRYKMSDFVIDTVLYDTGPNTGFVGMSDVNSNNQIIGITGIDNKVHLATSDISNINFESVLDMSQTFGSFYPTGLCWSNDNLHAYITIHNLGLYRVNVLSKEIDKLIGFCDTKKYRNISCSSDGKFLIAERVNSVVEKNSNGQITNKILQSSLIYKIDLTTLEESKINL